MITKKQARAHFKGESGRLFESAWRELNKLGQDYFDEPLEAMKQIISQKVNNPKSSFYIYGE